MVWAVPLTTMELIPHGLTPTVRSQVFVVWFGLVSSRPLADPEPYPLRLSVRLHLNALRGEPAISVFDWHFTSTHSSSLAFALVMSSDLHEFLHSLHPGHG